jgi:hypothetical protein
VQALKVVVVAAVVAAGGWSAPAADAGIVLCAAGPGHGDGRIRLVGDPYVGDGVYNCVGTDQTETQVREPGQKAKFDVRVRNDTTLTRNVRIGTNAENDDLNVKYFLNGANVTDKVNIDLPGDNAGLRFKNVPAGASTPAVRVVIKVKNTASAGPHAIDIAGYIGVDFLHADIPYAVVNVGI